MDWRQVADLEVEERYWRRRLADAERAEQETRSLLRDLARNGSRLPMRVRLAMNDAEADVERMRRRLVLVQQMKAARDAEGCAA